MNNLNLDTSESNESQNQNEKYYNFLREDDRIHKAVKFTERKGFFRHILPASWIITICFYALISFLLFELLVLILPEGDEREDVLLFLMAFIPLIVLIIGIGKRIKFLKEKKYWKDCTDNGKNDIKDVFEKYQKFEGGNFDNDGYEVTTEHTEEVNSEKNQTSEKSEKSKPMNFTLETEGGAKKIISDARDCNILINKIEYLNEKGNSWLVLEPECPINDCKFIQVLIDEGDYIVELRTGDDDSWIQYRHIADSMEKVKEIFVDFFSSHKLPVLEEWEDVSDEV